VERYDGGFKDDYPQLLARVRTLVGLAQQEIAVKLGLFQYGRGFYHPVSIRFDDSSQAGTQNPFFYIRPSVSTDGFSQDLMVNVEVFARQQRDPKWEDRTLNQAFDYTMTELMLNDLAGGEAYKKLPVWVQEGLAVYCSGSGEELVEEVAEDTPRSKARDLAGDLNRSYRYLTKRQWARYYLAIKYITETGGVDSLQAFARDVIGGKSVADTILNTLSQDWPTFEKNVKDYTFKTFLQLTPDDDDPRFKTRGDSSSDHISI